MWNEFKAFVMRGNVVDMAVGVVLGTAFGKIITSLVSDILMPPVGLLLFDIRVEYLYSWSAETLQPDWLCACLLLLGQLG